MGWWIAGLVPLAILLGLIVTAGVDFRTGSNLWPLGLIFYVPVMVIYYVILGVAKWIVSRRAAKQRTV
jgi:hypothetical protein